MLFLGKAVWQITGRRVAATPLCAFFRARLKERVTRLRARPDDNMESLDRELKTQDPVQQAIVDTVRQAILVLDQNDVITIANGAVLRLWNVSEPLVGKCIFNTALLERRASLETP